MQAEVLWIVRGHARCGDDHAQIACPQHRGAPEIDVEPAFHRPGIAKPAVGDPLHLDIHRHRRSPRWRESPAQLHAHARTRLTARDQLRIPEEGEYRSQIASVLHNSSEKPGAVADAAGERVIRRLEHCRGFGGRDKIRERLHRRR